MATKGQEYAADVASLLRARNPLLWIISPEEGRVERLLIEAAAAAGYMPQTWDVAQGVCNAIDEKNVNADLVDPSDLIAALQSRITDKSSKAERVLTIMRDLPVWISGPTGATTLRRLRNFARKAPSADRDRSQAIVILTPSSEVPAELRNHATVIDWPIPDREEIAGILDGIIRSLPEFEPGADGNPDTERPLRALAAPNGIREAAIDAAVGLTDEEARACYARSLVSTRRIEPVSVAKEKRRVIARERVLEWYDPLPEGLDAVGGLEELKTWLLVRRNAYSKAARDYGLPRPKGVFLAGISGCGKSLTAKATATAFGCPLLKIDLGSLKSKFVGDSEQNLRKAFRVVEAIGRCVVWFDEIEKSLQGATSGSSDGGVSSDALGAVLTWMQERQGDAFVIATANDVSNLPPELLRKGRFDDIFFVDLPNAAERRSVLKAALREYGRADALVDVSAVTEFCKNYTGSEIAAIVPDALYRAFGDDARALQTDDLIIAAKSIVPLSKTKEEDIAKLKKWAAERARPASRSEIVDTTPSTGRVIDL